MADNTYDLIVIGGGPGGYVAAIRAAQLGLKTAVVEREHLGGVCLNWGCIPTKALLRSAEVYRLAREGEQFGVSPSALSADVARIVSHSREAATRLNGGVAFLLKKNKIDVIWGEATIAGKGEVQSRRAEQTANAAAIAEPQNDARRRRLSGETHHRRDRRPPARAARP